MTPVERARPAVYRTTALAVVLLFAALPAASRLHDRLSAADNVGGFRISKNIDRPHEKHSSAPLIATTLPVPDRDSIPTRRVDLVLPLAPQLIFFGRSHVRPPPAR